MTDGMVESVVMGGTAEECRARISEYRRAGVTLPIIYPVHPGFTGYRPDVGELDGIREAIRGLGEW